MTRRKFTSEEKIRIVFEGLRGEESISTICRKEGNNPNLYYRWSNSFLEAGKNRLSGDARREATSDEVTLLGIPKSTFYDWYGRYFEKGFDGLKPQHNPDRRQWNQIPEKEREEVVEIALDQPDKSPGRLAFHITDTRGWFVSESSVYRILKSRGLIASPTHIVTVSSLSSDQDEWKDFYAMICNTLTYSSSHTITNTNYLNYEEVILFTGNNPYYFQFFNFSGNQIRYQTTIRKGRH